MDILKHLDEVLEQRKNADHNSSYVSKLYSKGLDSILKKIAEEAGEVIMASKDAQYTNNTQNITYEIADLWFHSLILLHQYGLSSQDVINELNKREGLSGILEKQQRSPQ